MAETGQRWLDALADRVDRAGSFAGALDAAEAWARGINDDEAFADSLYRTSFHSFLAGQLMVRAVELEEEAADGAAGTATLDATRALDGSFLGMPFEEALAFFRAKQLISEEEFDALSDRYKSGGFIARRLASERMQEVARQAIERVMHSELTAADAARIIRAGEGEALAGLGISPQHNGYIETVVRTGVQTAYGHGRWQAMNDPNVVALRPAMQYWTAGDARVRPNHRALHGKAFRLGTDAAAFYAPPLGYNCRCSAVTLSQRQIDSRGIEVLSSPIAGVEPDDGWSNAPAPLSEADL
jgi:SPP1 gp7 family putative phage head morphogenesis protein